MRRELQLSFRRFSGVHVAWHQHAWANTSGARSVITQWQRKKDPRKPRPQRAQITTTEQPASTEEIAAKAAGSS